MARLKYSGFELVPSCADNGGGYLVFVARTDQQAGGFVATITRDDNAIKSARWCVRPYGKPNDRPGRHRTLEAAARAGYDERTV